MCFLIGFSSTLPVFGCTGNNGGDLDSVSALSYFVTLTKSHNSSKPQFLGSNENYHNIYWYSIGLQFSSVAQINSVQLLAWSRLTLCDPMNCSTPGLPVHHQLPEFTQLTSIKLVLPSSHLILGRPLLLLPLIPPSIRVFSNESTLCIRWPKYWSFSFSVIPSKEEGWSPLEWTSWISLQSKGLSRVFSNTTVQKHQFFSAQLSSQSNSHIHTWPREKP